MSRLPRRDLIVEPEVGIYHCVQRAMRRAFLRGQDAVTGQNFDHRNAWFQQRLELSAGQFGIEDPSLAGP
ncbi:MAG: Type I secretion system protein TolC [Planctomycetota bacterium]|nr:Type I secretion system protein TolC [Planctomycetota bacterium]